MLSESSEDCCSSLKVRSLRQGSTLINGLQTNDHQLKDFLKKKFEISKIIIFNYYFEISGNHSIVRFTLAMTIPFHLPVDFCRARHLCKTRFNRPDCGQPTSMPPKTMAPKTMPPKKRQTKKISPWQYKASGNKASKRPINMATPVGSLSK